MYHRPTSSRKGLICCAFLAISCLRADDPAWYSQPQFFTSFNGYFFAGDKLLPRVPFTGQQWGITPTAEASDAGYIEFELARWKAATTGPYFASVDMVFNGDAPPAWDSFRMRIPGGQYLNEPDGLSMYSISSPVYQAYRKSQAIRAVDLGADGMHVDDVQTQIAVMFGMGSHSYAGSFDSVTMSAFNTYLGQKYAPDQLQARYGISDLSSFDYGVYIVSNGLTGSWNSFPLTGLALDFFTFRRQETLLFLRDLVSSTKQYALQKYGRNFLFSTNAAFDEMAVFARDVMDLSTNEALYIKGQGIPFMAPYIKAWKGWKGPSLILPETGIDKPTVNLERVIIADIQAAGGMPSATTRMNFGLGRPQSVDLSVVNRYANFILSNPLLMSQTTAPAKIALIESAPSVIGGNSHLRIQSPAEPNPLNGLFDYLGTARLLLDSGLTYDSVFLPDSTYSTLPSPGPQDLARYSVVIAASTWALDDMQARALLEYAEAGGTLIVIGSFGNSQSDGSIADRPRLLSLLANAGVTTSGLGQIVIAKELFGVEYQADDPQVQRDARAAFQTFMTPYALPDVQVSGVQAVVHEPGVTPFFYLDRNGSPLVHLVNYDYDDAADQFYSKSDVSLRVRVGSQQVDEVIMRSPDFVGVQSVPFFRDGEFVSLVVPQVDAWVVLSFQQNQYAPVVTSFTPAERLGAVGNETLSFSVQALDPDGNALTYQWSVNGQIVGDAFGPSYSFQVPPGATGVYVVTAAVIDGSNSTETSWRINVASYRPPRLLFDETHQEVLTLSAARARQMYPNSPSFGLASILGKALDLKYRVTDFSGGSLTAEVLAGTDILVLAAPNTPLTGAEIQAVTNFVQSGGALIYLGGANISTSINTLLKPWGMQLDNTLLESSANACAVCFELIKFASHPSVGHDPNFLVNSGASFVVAPPAVGVAQTTDYEWRSLSGKTTRQASDPAGPFWMAAIAEAGKGRVFAVSGYTVNDSTLADFDTNLNFFLSGLAWATANVNVNPPPPMDITTMSPNSKRR